MNETLGYMLLFMGWYLSGWLPSRVVKHYFIEHFGTSLGAEDAWGRYGEFISALCAILGPLNLIGTLIARLSWGGKWGWKW